MDKINFVNNSQPAINDTNLNKLQDNVEDAINNDVFDLIYPIGSIYMSVSSTNPSNLFGGTWEQLKDRFLLGAGDTYLAGSVDGEATHTLTIDEIPSHSHDVRVVGDGNGGGTTRSNYQLQIGSLGTLPSVATYTTGSSQSHNNMPPYLTVYMWKRIS